MARSPRVVVDPPPPPPPPSRDELQPTAKESVEETVSSSSTMIHARCPWKCAGRKIDVSRDRPTAAFALSHFRVHSKHLYRSVVKAAFHDTDIETDSPDTPTSLRPTRAISWSYFCEKLNGEVARHADILATILARMSVSVFVSVWWNAGFSFDCNQRYTSVCPRFDVVKFLTIYRTVLRQILTTWFN